MQSTKILMRTRDLATALILALVVCSTPVANAQATRTWVSGVGDDANPCSRTAPCKTFAGAISKTAPGGEIDALDPGGFGALTITKSITLDGGGGQVGSVLVAGTNGIVVAAATNDVVIIRNMRLNGLLGNGSASGNAGINGIRFLTGAALHIENCYIFGFNTNGIDIEPTSQPANGAQVFIEDTTSENNGNDGLYVKATGTLVHVSVANSKFKQNANAGIEGADFTRPIIHTSEINGNTQYGLLADAATGNAYISISDSAVNNNGTGMMAGGAATSVIRLANVSMFTNFTGFATSSNGQIQSFGNNFNVNPGTPTSTLSPQ